MNTATNTPYPKPQWILLSLCVFVLSVGVLIQVPANTQAQDITPEATAIPVSVATPLETTDQSIDDPSVPDNSPETSSDVPAATSMPDQNTNTDVTAIPVEPVISTEIPAEMVVPTQETVIVITADSPVVTVEAATPTLETVGALETATLTPTSTSENLIFETATLTPTETASGLRAAALALPAAVAEPEIELSVSCPTAGVAAFTLFNVGGDMLSDGRVTVSSPSQSEPFKLLNGQEVSFEGAGDAEITVRYRNSVGVLITLSAVGNCGPRPSPTPSETPVLSATPTLSSTPRPTRTPGMTLTPSETFTPSNTPTPGPTFTPSATLTASATSTPRPTRTPGPSPTPRPSRTPTPSRTPSNTPTITSTPSITFTPTETFTPSATFTPSDVPTATATFTPSNTPTATLVPTARPGTPVILLSVWCLPAQPGQPTEARFRMRNVGGAMTAPGTYTIVEPRKPTRTDNFLLTAGETKDLILTGDTEFSILYSTLVLSNVSLSVVGACLPRAVLTSTPTATAIPANTVAPILPNTNVPPAPATLSSTETPTLEAHLPSLPMPTLTLTETPMPRRIVAEAVRPTVQVPVSAPVLTVGSSVPEMLAAESIPGPAMEDSVCPDWLAYHTDKTSDWEIFRLGDLPNGVQADPNLSRGVGVDVKDIMPSRSPDARWIAFASNRDDNWEIYLSAVEQSVLQRVTQTSDASELDPVWSPTGERIVYESDRDGNWNLYLFDVGTGVETRLTRSMGNDINASWSPDGLRLVFQSDREGVWQIYELTLSTMTLRRLTDGVTDSQGPQYSNDGTSIAFHSVSGPKSVLYVMSSDGTNVKSISEPSGYATNYAWSPDDTLIAYQSDVDGDDDIYVYEVRTGVTRLLTDNTIRDYAPTWHCYGTTIVFTSDVMGDSNLFSANALPITAAALIVENEASQLTFDPSSDQYPVDSPSEEDASRQQAFSFAVESQGRGEG